MRLAALSAVVFALAGCPGGGAGIGDSCGETGDCASNLQCLSAVCVPRCQRSPDCGDGYACSASGICEAASGQAGTACTSEDQCAAGLSCQLSGSETGATGELLATCAANLGENPADATCAADADCRHGTCALGRCVELCDDSAATAAACPEADTCVHVPRVGTQAAFGGCLPAASTIAWEIPATGPSSTLAVPVPSNAASISLVMAVDDVNQEVGAVAVHDPAGADLFELSADPFSTKVRFFPQLAQSVLEMPSSPDTPLVTGVYSVDVASMLPPFTTITIGSAIPRIIAVAKLGTGATLDLHFHFADFTDHPCQAAFANATLNASAASTAAFFQSQYLPALTTVLAGGGITVGNLTYDDVAGHPDLDGLDVKAASELLALGSATSGIDVFFVRTLAPVGLQAFGPNPGPGTLPGTRQSGIIVGLDTLCYASWPTVAQLTAHELAHYMGLYDNVVLGHPDETDPISDSDTTSNNLMFFSAQGGTALSAGQRDILQRSPVLR